LDQASEDENVVKIIIAGDKSWVYGCDVETKMQPSQWVGKNSRRPKKARRVRSKVKVMLTVSFDIDGVGHHKFLRQGKTINRWLLSRNAETSKRKCQEKKTSVADKQLPHDFAPAHAWLPIRDFLANRNTTVFPQPPYSPDLTLADSFLFAKLKSTLKG
jgi:hypothetical protein